jgi:hypothetical protein
MIGIKERPLEPADPQLGARLAFWLGKLRVADAQRFEILEIVPLCVDGPDGAAFVLLDEALAAGWLQMEEIGHGNVNQVIAANKGNQPVLILQGQVLVGSKQNRVVAVTVLIGPGEKVGIPVGCVEQHRWRWTSPGFHSGDASVSPSLRTILAASVAKEGTPDQVALWAMVGKKLRMGKVQSPTADYMMYHLKHKHAAEDQARRFPSVPGQIGLLALIEGRLLGFEALGHPDNWRAHATRVLPTYVLEAADAQAYPELYRKGEALAPEEWLIEIAGSRVHARPAIGMGTQLALTGPGFAGTGLWHDGRPAHVAVFPD